MTYSAPHQGLFAIVIIISMALHLLFLVLSQEHKQLMRYADIAEYESVQISDELSAPMSAHDTVSISVIAGRYLQKEMVSFIGIYDTNDIPIVSVGEQSQVGKQGKQSVTAGNQVLGSVVVQTPDVSRAKIIADHKLFIFAIFVLHVMVWVMYTYLARPPKELQDEISQDVRARLLTAGILPTADTSVPIISMVDDGAETSTPASAPNQATAKSKLTDMLRSDNTTSVDVEDIAADSIIITTIRFDDRYQLLNTVGHHTKSAYFALCNQLLDKAVEELLKLPVLSGVSVYRLNHYNDKGANVLLQADNSHAKAATAAVMLAKLMLMLNHIVYDKHRELKRFCLPIRTAVSGMDNQGDIFAMMRRHSYDLLILLSESEQSQVLNYAELDKLPNPTTLPEQKCRYLGKVSATTAERLEHIRNVVLLSD